MLSLSNSFACDEMLLRAVYPPEKKPSFWVSAGHVSSAAFKDPRGLSVDRTGGRSVRESVKFIRGRLEGFIVSFSVEDCKSIKAELLYKPTKNNEYHSEVHGDSEDDYALSDEQALLLSRRAIIEYSPE